MLFHQCRKLSRRLRLVLTAGAAVGGLSLMPLSAHADPFASFSDQGTTASVVFANLPTSPAKNAYTGASTTTVSNELVNFAFGGVPNLPPQLLGAQSAWLSYSVTTTEGASTTSVPGFGTLDSQPVNQTFTLRFVRTTPFTPAGNPKLQLTNLLTVTLSAQPGLADTAQMYGVAGSSSVHLDSDASYANVDFTSDFLNFDGTTDHSMALSYTLQTLEYLGIGAKFLTAYDKTTGGTTAAKTCPTKVTTKTALCNYRGFTATESGNFGSAPPPATIFTIAEPTTVGVFGFGLIGLAASRRRRPA